MASRGNITGRTYAARWSSEEDKLLLEHVLDHGTSQWALLQQSQKLGPHRDSKACCNRFLLLKRKFVQDANKAESSSSSMPSSGTIPSIMSGCGLTDSIDPLDPLDPLDSEEAMMDFPVPPMPVHEIMCCLHASAAEMDAEEGAGDAGEKAADGAGNPTSGNPSSGDPTSDAHGPDAPASVRASGAGDEGAAAAGENRVSSTVSSTIDAPRGSCPMGAGLASAVSSTDSSPAHVPATTSTAAEAQRQQRQPHTQQQGQQQGQQEEMHSAESSSYRADSRKSLDEHNKAISWCMLVFAHAKRWREQKQKRMLGGAESGGAKLKRARHRQPKQQQQQQHPPQQLQSMQQQQHQQRQQQVPQTLPQQILMQVPQQVPRQEALVTLQVPSHPSPSLLRISQQPQRPPLLVIPRSPHPPHTAPFPAPLTAPHTAPFPAPLTAPHTAPFPAPLTAPHTAPFPAPLTAPHTAPLTTPHPPLPPPSRHPWPHASCPPWHRSDPCSQQQQPPLYPDLQAASSCTTVQAAGPSFPCSSPISPTSRHPGVFLCCSPAVRGADGGYLALLQSPEAESADTQGQNGGYCSTGLQCCGSVHQETEYLQATAQMDGDRMDLHHPQIEGRQCLPQEDPCRSVRLVQQHWEQGFETTLKPAQEGACCEQQALQHQGESQDYPSALVDPTTAFPFSSSNSTSPPAPHPPPTHFNPAIRLPHSLHPSPSAPPSNPHIPLDNASGEYHLTPPTAGAALCQGGCIPPCSVNDLKPCSRALISAALLPNTTHPHNFPRFLDEAFQTNDQHNRSGSSSTAQDEWVMHTDMGEEVLEVIEPRKVHSMEGSESSGFSMQFHAPQSTSPGRGACGNGADKMSEEGLLDPHWWDDLFPELL
ncbi:hypothetical protein CLOM_g1249 [Closterium sp. NIES-68]|nr:hypothetical protein CLOM_g1249 [Closterium sp. NIES-68]GJP79920.1 hypothetical protein CLOP_g10134 [Closterium sp. NIES-67]